jgi:hypothetical protein
VPVPTFEVVASRDALLEVEEVNRDVRDVNVDVGFSFSLSAAAVREEEAAAASAGGGR